MPLIAPASPALPGSEVGDPVQIDLVALFDGFSGGPGFGQA